MRVVCRHGHFAFYPRDENDIARFAQYFKFPLVQDGDFYTFELLAGAPRYSLKLAPWLGLPAVKTYEGRGPWDVMRENGFVYDITSSLLVLKTSVLTLANLSQSTNYYLTPSALLQPGARVAGNIQILSYDGEFIGKYFQLKIRSFSYE